MATTKSRGKGSEAVRKAEDPVGFTGSTWNMPVMGPGDTFRDFGSLGLRAFSGWVREEFLPQLVGRQAARTYREMLDNDATIGALMFAIKQSMRKIEWRVEPADDTPAAKEMADFVESLREDMSHTWEDFIVDALSMCGYGYAPIEIVYKRRLGRQPYDPVGERDGTSIPSSEYNDGLIGWRRLPIRGQDTVLKWFFSVNGDIMGMTQQPWIGQLTDIPIEKMLLFRPDQHKNNPEGRSILRNSYRSWFFIKRMQEQEAILYERMSGFPVMYVPNALLEAASAPNPSPAAVAALAAYKKMTTNIRIDEQMGAVLPSDPWMSATGPSSVRMYEFQLVTPQANRSTTGSDTIIKRYQMDILMTCLADFINLGHTSRGTQNLAISKVDMFFQAIEGWLNSIAAVLNRHALPRIWLLNNFDLNLMPKLTPDLAQRVDIDSLGNFLLHAAQAGMPLFPDADLENYIRDAVGMPDVTEEGAYASTGNGADKEKMIKMLRGSIARRQKRLPFKKRPSGVWVPQGADA